MIVDIVFYAGLVSAAVFLAVFAFRLARFLWIIFKPLSASEKEEFERKYGIEEIKRKHNIGES